MSVEEPKRTLAYICPACRQSVIVERDLFSLAAATAHIKCPCGRSELRVEFVDDHVDLEVPCLFCGREHRVSCSTHAFLHQKALAFSCAASGLDCCYVGEEGPVFAATARLERAADKLKEEQAAEEKAAFLDEIVMHEVLSEVKDIAARGRCLLRLRLQGMEAEGELQLHRPHLRPVRRPDAHPGRYGGRHRRHLL